VTLTTADRELVLSRVFDAPRAVEMGNQTLDRLAGYLSSL
jgi:hypothetical protein